MLSVDVYVLVSVHCVIVRRPVVEPCALRVCVCAVLLPPLGRGVASRL